MTQPVEPQLPDPALGHIIEDRYRLDSVLGRGGFGTVYRAAHQRLPRDFAVKVLHAARAVDPQQVERFRQEVRAAAVVRHPYVVEVVDYGHDSQVGYFIVMPLLEGQSLLERLGEETVLPIVDVDTVVAQMTAGLHAAHAHGIVHCDIKAENVHLVRDTSASGFHVCILDFGVARAQTLPGRQDAPETTPQSTRVVGTALSMSPEQVLRERLDGRADIYGLGVVLYEMLTGVLPFLAENPAELMRMHVQDQPPRPSMHRLGKWIPPALDEFVLSLLAKNREDRPQSMLEVMEQWERMRPQIYDAWAAAHLIDRVTMRISGTSRAPDLTLRLTASDPPMWVNDGMRPRTPGGLPGLDAVTPRSAVAPIAKVLVVDDDESIRSLLRLILQSAGWTCATVASGHQALVWLRDHPQPDVVVLDMLMPGMDGRHALREMRGQGYLGPALFCTSVDSAVVRSEVETRGLERYVTKGRELHTIPQVLLQLGLTPG